MRIACHMCSGISTVRACACCEGVDVSLSSRVCLRVGGCSCVFARVFVFSLWYVCVLRLVCMRALKRAFG